MKEKVQGERGVGGNDLEKKNKHTGEPDPNIEKKAYSF